MRTPVYQERHLVTTSRTAWTPRVSRAGDVDDSFGGVRELDPGGPDPYADEPKWPAWKVTIAVVIFCGAFWSGVGFLATRLLG